MKTGRILQLSIVLVLILLLVSPMAAVAQEPTTEPQPITEITVEPTVQSTVEPTVQSTVEPTVQPTVEPTVQSTVEPTVQSTVEPTVQPTVEPTMQPTVEPTVEVTVTVTPLITPTAVVTLTSELSDASIEAAGALPGNSTTSIIAVANIGSSQATVNTTLFPYPSGTDLSIGGSPVITAGGVHFYRASDITQDGRFGASIQSDQAVAAAAVMENTTAHTADAYPGLSGSDLGTQLFGLLVFNKHVAFGGASFESTLICQNAGSSAAHVSAELFKKGESTSKVTISTADSGQAGDHGGAMLQPGHIVVWDIVDMARVQSAWAGGNGQIGYARFTSTENIACVVQNDRLLSGGYLTAQFQAIPSTFAATALMAPLVYNGHGYSSANNRGTKWNSSITLVNPNSTDITNVTVTFRTAGGYTYTCSRSIPANAMVDWFAPEIGTGTGGGAGWTCPAGAIAWAYPSNYTLGAAQISASSSVLAVINSTKYDAALVGTVGYAGLAASPSIATSRAVCPVNWNVGSATSTWVSGVQVVNVGGAQVDFTVKMVRADTEPTIAANFKDYNYTNVAVNDSRNTYFPEVSGLANFEGAVFVAAANSGDQIVAGSSSTNYGSAVNGAAFYGCINY